MHLGVYGSGGRTLPACNTKTAYYEFSATNNHTMVTCKRCQQTFAYENRWYAARVRESRQKVG